MARSSQSIKVSRQEYNHINSKIVLVCNYFSRRLNPSKKTKSIGEIAKGHVKQYRALIAKLKQYEGSEYRTEYLSLLEAECNKTCCGSARYSAARKFRSELFE